MLTFLTFAPAQQRWHLGGASSLAKSISVFDGHLRGYRLVVSTAVHRRGSFQPSTAAARDPSDTSGGLCATTLLLK